MELRSCRIIAAFLLLAALPIIPMAARAHCDALDGPVVNDARRALEKGDPAPVLKWVGKDREAELTEAFRKTVAVRGKGEDAKALADRWFFETLVRIHRAGEGEAFTGLKPAGGADPGLAEADKALQAGSAEELAKEVSSAVADGIRRRFASAADKKKRMADSVETGRGYVAAYVDYIHFVEAAHRLAAEGAGHRHATKHDEP